MPVAIIGFPIPEPNTILRNDKYCRLHDLVVKFVARNELCRRFMAIPGVGPFIAAGPIMATLAGLGVGGAVGGLIGALVGLGIPEYEAKRYEGRLKDGGVLLSVHCDTADQITRAKAILTANGVVDIASTGETGVGSRERVNV